MGVTSGFFNSINGDRLYDAEQFSSFMDGIITDGVYQAVGNKFYVKAEGSMKVSVDTGRAWFDHTWTLNTSKYNLKLSAADTRYKRIDAVVLEVDKSDTVRANSFKIVKGTAASSPKKPSLKKTDSVKQYALAYITVNANATSISQSNIQYVVGSAETPLVSALSLAGIPNGGKIGQVLAKSSSEPGAVNWYDYDKLPFDKWYLTDGINESNVIAAYKFIERSSVNDALRPVNERNTNMVLTRSNSSEVTWDSVDGFYISWGNYLDNSSLRSAGINSLILWYRGGNTINSTHAMPITGNWDVPISIWLNMPYTVQSYAYRYTNAVSVGKDNGNGSTARKSSSKYGNAVIGLSYNRSTGNYTLYKNGTKVEMSKITDSNNYAISGFVAADVPRLIGGNADTSSSSHWDDLGHWNWGGYFNCRYCIAYSSVLNATQHDAIYKQLLSDAS